MDNKTKKIKKTWTLLPETVEAIRKLAKLEQRNENVIIDRLVLKEAKELLAQ